MSGDHDGPSRRPAPLGTAAGAVLTLPAVPVADSGGDTGGPAGAASTTGGTAVTRTVEVTLDGMRVRPARTDVTGRMPMRDFTGRVPVPGRPRMRFEQHAQVALLWTVGDRPRDWRAAGQALERALLVATAHGVRTSLLHQAMEWPDLREAMRVPGTRWCRPQVLIRFGYGPEANGTRPPRAAARPSGRPARNAVRTPIPGPPDPGDEDRRPTRPPPPAADSDCGTPGHSPRPAAPTDPGRTANREDGRHAPAVDQVESSTGTRCGRDRPGLADAGPGHGRVRPQLLGLGTAQPSRPPG